MLKAAVSGNRLLFLSKADILQPQKNLFRKLFQSSRISFVRKETPFKAAECFIGSRAIHQVSNMLDLNGTNIYLAPRHLLNCQVF